MAEIKTGIFAKNVQKRLNRAQEKVLQKLGKADETKDEQFEQVVINFRRQESEGSRLQREMKAYMSAIKGMQQASINLTQSLHEVYEPDWHGKDDVMVIGKDCDALWEDFHNKLVDSTLLDLDAYLQQFPDLKTRVAKRSRKLIDYDSARHHVETLQMSGMKNDRKITKVSLVICDETWISYSSCYLWCVQVLRGGQFVNQTCFCLKAEEELKKAQKVFDELNVGLQDELPTLWDSRVGFYITTFKSVTHLETKFHREISLVCRQLYEVMTKLSEQHSDKMFTIQGAPSDSGPLRLARTPSPPEDESPPDSPDFSSNHMLRPVSPGPPRPKSPTQLKKGPPVPPPPKVTPTKEVAEEQIIDLFGGEFLPAPSPSQPNERPGESLLDLDFDAFQPDDSVSPIPQTAVPWDMWSANTQTAEPAADAGFVADWSADFGSLSANGDAASGAEAPAVGLERAQGGAQGGAQGRPQADDWQPGADTATTHPQDSEPTTAAQDEVSSWNSQSNPDLHPSAVRGDEDETRHADSVGDTAGQEDRRKSTPGLIFTNEYGEQIEDSTEDRVDKWSRSPDGSGSEYETAEEWGDGGQGGGWASADDELSYEDSSPVNVSEGWGSENNGVAADWYQMVGNISPESNAADRKCSGEEKPTGNQTDVTSSCRKYSESRGEGHKSIFKSETQGGGVFDSVTSAETQGAGAFDSVTSAETQGGGTFDLDPFAETQGGGAFDLDPFAETQEGGAFDSDPFVEAQEGGAFDSVPSAETQGGGVFDSDPFAETQRGGVFDSDPFAEEQGGGAFDSDPFAETQEGGAFDSVPSAETQGGGAFDSDPFAEAQGGGAFDSVPSAETQGGGAFDSDPFAETQEGGAFDSDPFAETQVGGAFDSVPSAETQGGGAFDSDPFAETQEGGAFDSVPSAETQGGGAFDSDPFAETQGGGAFDLVPSAERQGGDKGGGFEFEPFTETSGEDRVGSAVNARGGWDTDLFASSFPEAFAGTEGSHSSGFDSSVTQQNSASAAVSGTAEAIKDVNVTRIHKEPENSDMSEDEAANRRFGKLYQELDTEKEEVTNTFNGFSQDATVPSFFADFDKMNEVTAETTEAPEALDTEVSEEQDKPAALPAGEEPTASSAGEEPTASSVGEEPTASPAGEEPTALSAGDEEEEEPKAGAEPPSSPAGKQIEEPPGLSVGDQDTGSSVSVTEKKSDLTVGSPGTEKAELGEIPPVDEAKPSPDEAAPSEKMPIPSVVIEPASSNEGDDDRDADIISPTAISDNGVTAGNQPIKHMSPSGGVSGLPDDFLYKVETMHDFEAANSDELELKRGDIVLVVPTASVEDQDAGWLTGIKESDWLTLGAGAHKGLFPENFTQRLE
uniref:amphiphysin isoform X4 n=1 Tax=Epinephelus lanceolatus TaxID=310571 RepID=UPI001446B7E2|nr:amphiphysin isoform X4 [Epinephelus lanceolatus]